MLSTVDERVPIPALDSDALAEIAAAVCGDDVVTPAVALARAVRPEHLQLARRPGQSAADYAARVTALGAAEAAASPKPVVRESGAPVWNLDTLHGAEEAVAWGRALASDLRAYAMGDLAWSEVDRGALLSGPPGCGKTTFARALAASCGVPLISTSYSEWQGAGREGHLGELTKCLRGRFAAARAAAPCILFIDELDSVQTRGATERSDDWWTAIVNALLAELDGIEGRDGVVVVGASNFADRVDPAIRRSGRLDREIRLRLPDTEALAKILAVHLGSSAAGLDLAPVARRLQGSSGADAERIARGSRRRARQAGRALCIEDLLAEVGADKPARTPAAARRIAVHEAGHAVVSAIQRPGSVVWVSVRSDGARAGGTRTVPPSGEDTSARIEAIIREHLAGRAAEEVVLGEAGAGSGGAPESDLATATLLSSCMEMSWGFSTLTWLGDVLPETVSSMLLMRPAIAARVEERLADALGGARDLLVRNRRALDAVTAALLERETLSGEDAESIIAACSPPSAPVLNKSRSLAKDATSIAIGGPP